MEVFDLTLSYIDIIILIICCFLGSMISTSVGSGGGLVVIGGMSMVLPTISLIAMHAFIQGSAGIFRAFTFRKTFLVRFFLLYTVGSLVGYFIGVHFLVTLPEYILKFILGVGIIVLNYLPKVNVKKPSDLAIIFLGIVTGFLTMFVGVMGPIVAIVLSSFVKQRHYIVGTIAWSVSLQNIGKAFIFGTLGFDYMHYLPLLLLLISFSALGVYAGKQLLNKSNDILFKKILKLVILLLGTKLIIDALVTFLSTQGLS